MKHRAIVQKNDWWIGWLVEIPGVNAQKKMMIRNQKLFLND